MFAGWTALLPGDACFAPLRVSACVSLDADCLGRMAIAAVEKVAHDDGLAGGGVNLGLATHPVWGASSCL